LTTENITDRHICHQQPPAEHVLSRTISRRAWSSDGERSWQRSSSQRRLIAPPSSRR